MRFGTYIGNGAVRTCRPDPQKARALVKMSERAFEAAEGQDMPEFKLTISYTGLRQVLEAITLLEGYAVFSHKAYSAFLKEKDELRGAERFDRFRKLRNGVEYYGKNVPATVA